MTTLADTWCSWFDAVTANVTLLRANRHVFLELRRLQDLNPRLQQTSWFYDFGNVTYVHYVAMAVRREVKINSDSLSFARLLDSMTQNPKALRRRWIHQRRSSFAPLDRYLNDQGDAIFDRFAGPNQDALDPTIIEFDHQQLKDAARLAETYADRIVAHRDKRGSAEVLLRDLHGAVATLCHLHERYHLLFKGGDFLLDEESFIGESWRDIFRVPWLVS